MGLFDKLKSAANFITGNAVKMEMELPTATRGVPFTITVTATVKDADVNIKRAYLKIQAFERVVKENIVQTETHSENQDKTVITTEKEEENQTLNLEVDICGELVLKAKETYTWTKEVTLPENAMPTLSTFPQNHYWLCLAGLDTKGNDPDTGWKDLVVL